MLSVYTRHSHECDHRDDINWRRCRCPKWIQGVIAEDRVPIRFTAKTRSWEPAEARARDMESAADPAKPQVKPVITIVEAVSSFRADEDGRCLEKTTVAQSRSLFENQLRWSGLAIKDAVTLERQRLGKDGRLFLYRAKTGVPVYFPCRTISFRSCTLCPTPILDTSSGVAKANLKRRREDGSEPCAICLENLPRSRIQTARQSVAPPHVSRHLCCRTVAVGSSD